MDIKGTERKSVNWIYLAEDIEHRQAPMNTVMNLRVS
jgi:hypothetical protein